MQIDETSLQGEVRKFLSDRFREVKILDVHIERDETFNDERVIEISVFFEGTPEELVRAKPPGLIGMLRERLESAFPVLSFIPVSNASA